jgi:protein-disulfide isomerase
MRQALAALLLLATALIPETVTAAAPASKVAPRRDWTRVVSSTPEGGFRIGNPAAAVKLVEYGSLACSHCRHFEETGYKPLLRSYVSTGRLSFEFRNFLINGPDISASLLARCSGPGKFFAMTQYIFATQPQWQKKLQDLSDADKAAIEQMTEQQRILRFAEVAGMPQIAARFGMPRARARQCLTDAKGLQRLLGMTQQAMDKGVDRTPTFLINGTKSDAATWEDLEPQLKAALGERG